MNPLDGLKAAFLLLAAGLLQVTLVTPLEVADGHPNVIHVLVVSIALLRGPLFGAVSGFWAGLVLDIAALQTLGLSSLVLTLAGYWSGRFGEATSRRSPHPPLVAVGLATAGVTIASGILHFMLGETAPASHVLGRVVLPTVALNVLLAYPLYRLCRRVFEPTAAERREAALV